MSECAPGPTLVISGLKNVPSSPRNPSRWTRRRTSSTAALDGAQTKTFCGVRPSSSSDTGVTCSLVYGFRSASPGRTTSCHSWSLKGTKLALSQGHLTFSFFTRSCSSSESSPTVLTSASFNSEAPLFLLFLFSLAFLDASSTARSASTVLVLPVPGGPWISVMPSTFRESRIAFIWDGLNFSSNHFSRTSGSWLMRSARATGASVLPSSKADAACISVEASPTTPESSRFKM
mmetsp:Transcript_75494/g.166769  ORF Transcript_75494/g.166769 Transcript_75494/m.166769 type:complete len:233 (+) Transcript_75494:1391-2089(+)